MDHEQRAVIEAECARLPLLYAKYADNGDHAALAGLFAENATYGRPFQPDDPLRGRGSIQAMFRDRKPILVRHIVTNVIVEVIDERHAKGTSYLTMLSNHASTQPPQEAGGLYVGDFEDQYVRTDEGWKFASRGGMVMLHIGGQLPTPPSAQDA
ncbi:MAG TPA: nuclear transport factor 2 family protein [Croceibacterium sp.]|nr:nuclear transport factor 2 family protein [Croceibacterium sp.]